jgi:hypothetical protein
MIFIGGRGGTRLRAFATTIAYLRTQPTRTKRLESCKLFLSKLETRQCMLLVHFRTVI